jgi:hypothetical protein
MYSAQKIVTDLADQVEKLPKAARPESALTQDDRQFLQELQETQKNLNVFSQDPAYGEQLRVLEAKYPASWQKMNTGGNQPKDSEFFKYAQEANGLVNDINRNIAEWANYRRASSQSPATPAPQVAKPQTYTPPAQIISPQPSSTKNISYTAAEASEEKALIKAISALIDEIRKGGNRAYLNPYSKKIRDSFATVKQKYSKAFARATGPNPLPPLFPVPSTADGIQKIDDHLTAVRNDPELQLYNVNSGYYIQELRAILSDWVSLDQIP